MAWIRTFTTVIMITYILAAISFLLSQGANSSQSGFQSSKEVQASVSMAATSLRNQQTDPPKYDAVLETALGDIRIQLHDGHAPLACAYVRKIGNTTNRDLNPCPMCSIYRAEPVPAWWGSEQLKDSSFGGRWGPPYALLQGSMGPSGPKAAIKPPPKDRPPSAHPQLRRGMVAWAGGGGGPHFFIALADHPEWGTAHTVFGNVLPEDMEGAVSRIMARPKTRNSPKNSAAPIVTNLDEPVSFVLTLFSE